MAVVVVVAIGGVVHALSRLEYGDSSYEFFIFSDYVKITYVPITLRINMNKSGRSKRMMPANMGARTVGQHA